MLFLSEILLEVHVPEILQSKSLTEFVLHSSLMPKNTAKTSCASNTSHSESLMDRAFKIVQSLTIIVVLASHAI